MLLEDRNAVIYGGGAIGGAVARDFAREGARVFLAGRTLATLDKVAEQIRSTRGVAETAQVDALDERAVGEHIDEVVEQAGSIDAPSMPSRSGTSSWSRSRRCRARISLARS